MESRKENYRIISMDGGGLHALSYLPVLENLEEYMGCGVSESKMFDLIVGTSTGTIVAVGLKLGMLSPRIRDLYVNHAKKIFTKAPFIISKLVHQYSPKYLLETLLEEFGTLKWKELCEINQHIDLVLVIWNVSQRRPSYISTNKKYKNPSEEDFSDVRVSDIVASCCSAPYYFPPRLIEFSFGVEKVYCDGGISGMNNPSGLGIYLANSAGFSMTHNLHVISLGAGEIKEEITTYQAKSWTVLEAAQGTVEALISSSSLITQMLIESSGRQFGVNRYLRTNQKRDPKSDLADYRNIQCILANFQESRMYGKLISNLSGNQNINLDNSELRKIWKSEFEIDENVQKRGNSPVLPINSDGGITSSSVTDTTWILAVISITIISLLLMAFFLVTNYLSMKTKETTLRNYIESGTFSTDIIYPLSKDPSYKVREAVAKSPTTPNQILEDLSNDDSIYVKAAVVLNSTVSNKILIDMLQKENQTSIQELILRRIKNIPDVPIDRFENKWVKVTLADRTTSEYVLDKLSKDVNDVVRAAVAKNISTPKQILSALSEDSSVRVRQEVARNCNADVEVLIRLAKDKNVEVKRRVAKNYNTTSFILNKLAADKDDRVRFLVIDNPNITKEILKKLENDNNKKIWRKVQEKMKK